MALYASHARGTHGIDLATLGAISAPLASLAPGQLFIASGNGTAPAAHRPGRARNKAKSVHADAAGSAPAAGD